MAAVSARAEETLVEVEPATSGIDEKPSFSWVVEMENMLIEHTDGSLEAARWEKPAIYLVPERIKRLTRGGGTAYRPQLVSLGPFHHGEPELLPMEEHKRRAVLHLVRRNGKPLERFVAAVEAAADDLMDAYCDLDDSRWRGVNRGRFVEMMLKDGCFLLEMMRTRRELIVGAGNGNALEDYAPNDPVFSRRGYLYLWPDVRSDMVLMENQLPLLVLQRLEAVRRGTSPRDSEVNNMVLNFLCCKEEQIERLGLHPLHLFYQSLCGHRPPESVEAIGNVGQQAMDRPDEEEESMPSAMELSESGIHFKKNNTKRINDIDFENGVLTMPLVELHDDTEKELLNLMAFERLHGSDVGNSVTEYVIFMDIIIKSERDVALLRSKGIVKNGLGSDKVVAKLFDT